MKGVLCASQLPGFRFAQKCFSQDASPWVLKAFENVSLSIPARRTLASPRFRQLSTSVPQGKRRARSITGFLGNG